MQWGAWVAGMVTGRGCRLARLLCEDLRHDLVAERVFLDDGVGASLDRRAVDLEVTRDERLHEMRDYTR